MQLRILALLSALTLVGCSDDEPDTTPDDAGFSPADGLPEDTTPAPGDTATADDTGAAPADTMTPDDTMSPSDTGAAMAMKCGTATCNASTQDCCVTAGMGACLPKGSTCSGAKYSCTSKANCGADQVCCISGAGTGGASCAAAGMCPSTTTCETNADCSGSMKNCTDIGAGIKACSK